MKSAPQCGHYVAWVKRAEKWLWYSDTQWQSEETFFKLNAAASDFPRAASPTAYLCFYTQQN